MQQNAARAQLIETNRHPAPQTQLHRCPLINQARAHYPSSFSRILYRSKKKEQQRRRKLSLATNRRASLRTLIARYIYARARLASSLFGQLRRSFMRACVPIRMQRRKINDARKRGGDGGENDTLTEETSPVRVICIYVSFSGRY